MTSLCFLDVPCVDAARVEAILAAIAAPAVTSARGASPSEHPSQRLHKLAGRASWLTKTSLSPIAGHNGAVLPKSSTI